MDKSFSLKETGSLKDYSGSTSFSVILGENTFYNTLEVDSSGIRLKIHHEDMKDYLDTIYELMRGYFQK